MKKLILVSLVAALSANSVCADVYRETVNGCNESEMRAALDRASAANRAVITIVECDDVVVHANVQPTYKPAPVKSCSYDCGKREEVVKREYFVRETVQQYEPVVQYIPTKTYTRVKPTCTSGC